MKVEEFTEKKKGKFFIIQNIDIQNYFRELLKSIPDSILREKFNLTYNSIYKWFTYDHFPVSKSRLHNLQNVCDYFDAMKSSDHQDIVIFKSSQGINASDINGLKKILGCNKIVIEW